MTAFAAIFLFLAPSLFAQDGQITGNVHDQTGAIIPGVDVTVTNENTGEDRMAVTNERGDYVVPGLKPSTYKVVANLAAFAPAEASGVQLVVGQRLVLDLTLRPAGVSETVTVEIEPEIVDTSSASMSANV